MKICVLGSHPLTRDKAPFLQTDWEIWACSTHNAPPHFTMPNFHRFYEVHPTSEHPTRPEDYQQWLDSFNHTVLGPSEEKLWMMDRRRRPWANAYPYERVVEEFGPHFIDTSSIAYIMAHAILTIMDNRGKIVRNVEGEIVSEVEMGGDVLGIFGVSQASPGEFTYQLPGIQFFATMAHLRGIDVAVPEESKILNPRKIDF